MKNFIRLGITLLAVILYSYNVSAQNPNWTMPPYYFDTDEYLMYPLPSGGANTYDGSPATHLDAAYSDDYGNLILFTVDEKVYDKDGNLVGTLFINNQPKKGHSERLILPMGNDCSRYAIIYQASPTINESYNNSTDGRRIYMAIYDLDAENNVNPNAIGALTYFNSQSTLVDISFRDVLYHGAPTGGPPIYDFYEQPVEPYYYQPHASNLQIASTELISYKDMCFFYVYVFDGKHVILYRLDNTDLKYGHKVWQVPSTHADWGVGSSIRSEMELIKLPNNNYRLAFPLGNGEHIGIVDTDGITGEILGNTYNEVHNVEVSTKVCGMEFNSTGQYLYFNGLPLMNYGSIFIVYDVNAQAKISIPPIYTGQKFRQSFIERVGNEMYVASNNYIGRLSNIDNPYGLSFDPTFLSIPGGGYGNSLGQGSNSSAFRYMLPDQIDMQYPELGEMSCDCCSRFKHEIETYTVSGVETWSPNSNPFTIGNPDVYIKNELRIEAGAKLGILGMNFHFGPTAKVIIENGDGTIPGGLLHITEGTVFTADHRCHNIDACGGMNGEGCKKLYWQGVEVRGILNDNTQSSLYQGQFTMTKKAMIEYAMTGVSVGSGLINIKNSKFKDNVTGIDFTPYTPHINSEPQFNKSSIIDNDFETTNDWIGSTTPEAFINVLRSTGIRFKGNRFENSNTTYGFADHEKGKGIKLTMARAIVDWTCAVNTIPCPLENTIRSEFKNLSYGIYGMNQGSPDRSIQCNYSKFENNNFGIFLSHIIHPILLDNEFIVPTNGSYPTPNSGIHLVSSTRYIVEGNSFTTVNSSLDDEAIGITVQASGGGNDVIYRNFFKEIQFGNIVVDNNRNPQNPGLGLIFRCNNFESIGKADIALMVGSTMALLQGSYPVPAGNFFSLGILNGQPGHFDLLSLALPDPQTRYFVYGNFNSYPQLYPANYTGMNISPPSPSAFIIDESTINYNSNSCKVLNTGMPMPEENGPFLYSSKSYGEYWLQASLYQLQLDSLLSLNTDISIEQDVAQDLIDWEQVSLLNEIDSFWEDIVRTYIWDTTGVLSSSQMTALLMEFQPKSLDRFAVEFLGDSVATWASEYAMGIPNFSTLPTLEDGKLPLNIPEYFTNGFFNNLGNVRALNNLYIENNAIYNPYVSIPSISEDSFGAAKIKNFEVPDIENVKSRITVTPNPFNETVYFDFSSYNLTGDNNRLEIYDVTGKKVYSKNILQSQYQLEISKQGIPEGVLLFGFYVDGNLVETGKLVKMK